MAAARRLMVIAAHPDDETLGFGGVLARYGREGVETSVVTATRGDRGRYFGHPQGSAKHPGAEELARMRARELHAAAEALGVRNVRLLGYGDQRLDEADVGEAVAAIARVLRELRPQIVLTFPPDGAYGHPDHIAISQLTMAAIVAAADPALDAPGAPHAVSKLYYVAWGPRTWDVYQGAFKKLVSNVDGVERQANAWPEWAITTIVDTRAVWPIVSRAVSCHESQVGGYEVLKRLGPAEHEALWGSSSFYRVFSRVNGGRRRETDLFEGIPQATG